MQERTAMTAKAKVVSIARAPAPRWKEWVATRLERAKREVFTESVEIGPPLAELLLELNQDNRPVSDVTVRIYARQMTEGK